MKLRTILRKAEYKFPEKIQSLNTVTYPSKSEDNIPDEDIFPHSSKTQNEISLLTQTTNMETETANFTPYFVSIDEKLKL
ncbi:hypothetical protein PMALA_041470 [Plasmodium malariae]|uniref:Uncharacterized protein n=1 Tax=Plasmodium malariae TaxID=5858 RepID=A0A1A8WLX7_PLAMA|nr:hypothetical protein PMALA_041470 [Plasmodium malariae]